MLIRFVIIVSRKFLLPGSFNRISLIIFDDKDASLIFDLTSFPAPRDLWKALKIIRYPPASQNNPEALYRGLVLAHEILFGASARPESSKVLVTVTTSRTAPNIKQVSSGIRSEGVESFAVDLNPLGNPDLAALVTQPSAGHLYKGDLSSRKKLRRSLRNVAASIVTSISGSVYFQKTSTLAPSS